MAYTIKDVAKHAGVSPSTISRYLNQSGYVGPATAKRIQQSIEALNYIPNVMARNLSTNSSNTIGVIVPDISNDFYGQVIKGITSAIAPDNYNIILYNTDEDARKELEGLRLIQENHVCGLIIALSTGSSQKTRKVLMEFKEENIPVVLVDRDTPAEDMHGVFVDNRGGAFNAVQLLINSGHKDIAIIAGPKSTSTGRDRYLGYVDAMSHSGLPVRDEFIWSSRFSYIEGRNLTYEALTHGIMPTAIFACNNLLALGCIKALRELNLKIPDDMALVCFDDIDPFNIYGMGITAVTRATTEMGAMAMNILKKKLSNPQNSERYRIVLQTDIKVCGSEKRKK